MKLLGGRPIPVFPLPSVVLYPRVCLPLYIFEPRYRQMLAEVLDSHGRIAMALLKPGWEPDYYDEPAVHPVVGVGRVESYRKRSDGTSDLILLGECRARIVEWDASGPRAPEPGEPSYRRAHLEELKDRIPPSTLRRENVRRQLTRSLSTLTRRAEPTDELDKLQKMFRVDRDLGFLVDFLAYHFLADVESKQTLLEELQVEERLRLLELELGREGHL